MKTAYFCKTDEFCPLCKESGGEYGVPLEYFCASTLPCQNRELRCLFRQHWKKHNIDVDEYWNVVGIEKRDRETLEEIARAVKTI